MKKLYEVTVPAMIPVSLFKLIEAASPEDAKRIFLDITQRWESVPEILLPEVTVGDYRLHSDEIEMIEVTETVRDEDDFSETDVIVREKRDPYEA